MPVPPFDSESIVMANKIIICLSPWRLYTVDSVQGWQVFANMFFPRVLTGKKLPGKNSFCHLIWQKLAKTQNLIENPLILPKHVPTTLTLNYIVIFLYYFSK